MAGSKPRYNLEGQSFGGLKVLRRAGKTGKHYKWLCLCECGAEKEILQTSLLSGHTKGCGICTGLDHRHKKHELAGKRYGKLTVVDRATTEPGKHARWNCVCDCGHKWSVTQTHIVSRKASSCVACSKARGATHSRWSGVGEINGAMISRIRNNARARNLPFEITDAGMWELFLAQDRRCAMSGLELSFYSKRVGTAHTVTPTASLDRIDSKIGYVDGNVQWVHKDVNMMKQSYTTHRFLELCKLIHQHNKDNEHESR